MIFMSHQITFLSLGCLTKRPRADRFLGKMNRMMPWSDLAEVVAPHAEGMALSQVFTELTHGEEQVIAGDWAHANAMLKANGRQAGLVYLADDKGTRAILFANPPSHSENDAARPGFQFFSCSKTRRAQCPPLTDGFSEAPSVHPRSLPLRRSMPDDTGSLGSFDAQPNRHLA